jgi:hypothetical protein
MPKRMTAGTPRPCATRALLHQLIDRELRDAGMLATGRRTPDPGATNIG